MIKKKRGGGIDCEQALSNFIGKIIDMNRTTLNRMDEI